MSDTFDEVMVRAVGEYVAKGRIRVPEDLQKRKVEVSGYTQTRHGKPVTVGAYVRNQKKLVQALLRGETITLPDNRTAKLNKEGELEVSTGQKSHLTGREKFKRPTDTPREKIEPVDELKAQHREDRRERGKQEMRQHVASRASEKEPEYKKAVKEDVKSQRAWGLRPKKRSYRAKLDAQIEELGGEDKLEDLVEDLDEIKVRGKVHVAGDAYVHKFDVTSRSGKKGEGKYYYAINTKTDRGYESFGEEFTNPRKAIIAALDYQYGGRARDLAERGRQISEQKQTEKWVASEKEEAEDPKIPVSKLSDAALRRVPKRMVRRYKAAQAEIKRRSEAEDAKRREEDKKYQARRSAQHVTDTGLAALSIAAM